MNDVTEILGAIREGGATASEDLLPLLYDELRKLAESKMAREQGAMTLQATALVHEAYVRLVKSDARGWENRAHFFAAAAEAMRRILVEEARRKSRLKRGGGLDRQSLDDVVIDTTMDVDILTLNEALEKLESANGQAAELVKLRFFSGFTNEEAARALGISPRKANQVWAYARAWLLAEIETED